MREQKNPLMTHSMKQGVCHFYTIIGSKYTASAWGKGEKIVVGDRSQ